MNLCELTFASHMAVEDTPEILSFRCPDTGLLIWPLLRGQYFELLLFSIHYRNLLMRSRGRIIDYARALKALPQTCLHNFSRSAESSADVLIMASGAGHFNRQCRSFNRITDYFALEAPHNTLCIEGLFDSRVPRNRWNTNVLYYLPWQGLIDLTGKLSRRSRHLEIARNMVDHISRRTSELLDLHLTEPQCAGLAALTAVKIARLPAMLDVYSSILDKVRPKLILLEQGCYTDLGVFNLVARGKGIRIAEPQHGMVSRGHYAYMFAETLRQDVEFKSYLPHDFLGYGNWWNSQINAPVNKVVIGHPHHAEQRRGMAPFLGKRARVLLLSDGFELEKYVDLAISLKAMTGSLFEIVLRPHPLERRRALNSLTELESVGVKLDNQPDIYSSLQTAYAVVGEVSTGLFEAIGLAGHIYIWTTTKSVFGCPVHPFIGFGEADELAAYLRTPPTPPAVSVDDIWAPGWQRNYSNFLHEALELRCSAEHET